MAQLDYLNTGNNGLGTFGNEAVSEEQQEVVSQEQLDIEQMLPSVKQILEVIDEEVDAIADIRSYMVTLGESPDTDELFAEYRSRELYIGFLTRLKSNIASRVSDVEEIS